MSNESSWPTDQPGIAAKSPWPSGRGPAASDCKGWNLTKGSPREWLFGNVVETKVVGDDKNSCFKFVLDVHDHLGEVQVPRTARSGTWPRGFPGNYFLAMLLKQKLLGMIKVVVFSCFGQPWAEWNAFITCACYNLLQRCMQCKPTSKMCVCPINMLILQKGKRERKEE